MYYIKPAKGYLTSLFSNSRVNPVLGVIRPHQGIDISSDVDNTIVAAAAGNVRFVESNHKRTGFGYYLVITHNNGQESLYAHLSSIDVRVGQSVKQGQKIGVKGTTGNSTGMHLHFEISKGKWTNNFSNKIDPLSCFADPVTLELQKMLNKLGYGDLVEDGIYGDGTISAVSKYQKANRLEIDGVAGRGTVSEVEKAFKLILSKQDTVKPTGSTSPSLQAETDFTLASKARREIIVNAAFKEGAHKLWLEKLADGTISDEDIKQLAVKYVIDVNKQLTKLSANDILKKEYSN